MSGEAEGEGALSTGVSWARVLDGVHTVRVGSQALSKALYIYLFGESGLLENEPMFMNYDRHSSIPYGFIPEYARTVSVHLRPGGEVDGEIHPEAGDR